MGISGALLDTAERREMQGGLADEAEKLGLGGRPREMLGRVPEPVLRLGDGPEHGLGVNQAPGVLERVEEVYRLVGVLAGVGGVAEHDRPVGPEQREPRPSPTTTPALARR